LPTARTTGIIPLAPAAPSDSADPMDAAPPPHRTPEPPATPNAPHPRGRLALSVRDAGHLPAADEAASDAVGARFPCPVCGTRLEATREHCFGCGWAVVVPNASTQLATLRRGAGAVYLLMAISLFTAVPAVGALALAYGDRNKARGSWLDSHFEWQVDTLWGVFWMGVAVLAATWLGDHFLGTGEWLLLAGLPALAWYARRIVKGWTRLSDGEPVTEY
jgi:uncharacterized membrane protein